MGPKRASVGGGGPNLTAGNDQGANLGVPNKAAPVGGHAPGVSGQSQRSSVATVGRVSMRPVKASDQDKQTEASRAILNQFVATFRTEKTEAAAEPKRFLRFDADALKQGHSLEAVFDVKKQEIDIRDVIDMDEDDIEEIITGDIIMSGVESNAFRMFITFVIITNAALIGVRTDDQLDRQFQPLFSTVDSAVLVIFVAEMLLKMYASFILYWHDMWNILDFIIVICLLFNNEFSGISSSLSVIRILRILRILRAFRSLRNFPILAGLSVLIETIIRSVPDMLNIGFLLMIFLCVISILGASIFNDMKYFENFTSTMWTNFVSVTEDGWWDSYYEIRYHPRLLISKWGGAYAIVFGLYFVGAISIGAFLFKNLVIAAVINNLATEMEASKRKEQQERELINATRMESGAADKEDKSHGIEERENMGGFYDLTKLFSLENQKPLEVTDLSTLTYDKFARFTFLVTAFEENLAEYANIKEHLDQIVNMIWDINQAKQHQDLAGDMIDIKVHRHTIVNEPRSSYIPYGTDIDEVQSARISTNLQEALAEESRIRFESKRRKSLIRIQSALEVQHNMQDLRRRLSHNLTRLGSISAAAPKEREMMTRMSKKRKREKEE